MRLVSIAPYRIVPPDTGGRLVIFGPCCAYAKLTEAFLCLALTTLRDRRSFDVPFRYREKRAATSLLIAFDRLGLFPKVPYLWSMRGYARRLAQEALAEHPDVIEVHLPWLAPVRRHLPARLPMVLVTQNVEAVWYGDYIRQRWWPSFFQRWIERIEAEGVRLADHVICLTPNDRDELVRRYRVPAEKLSVIPPGYEGSAVRPLPRLDLPAGAIRRGLLVGTRTPSNIDAARQLVERVAPSCVGRAEFVVAGTVCEELRGRSLPANVRLKGYVRDLEPLYDEADLFVFPLEMDGIANTKVIQALARGLPVVSTSAGMRGYEDLAGGPIRVAAVAEFARAIEDTRPLTEKDLEKVRRYEWDEIARRRLRLYQDLAADRSTYQSVHNRIDLRM
ncbi:MAG: glycosyltransferase family 4 protein [Verrucomicrobia bacterium]|nr:glycosyltransferase family 4 protein [Verrucomicrobiota bacterium]MBU1909333.1 glycosyltransferase family 4 protein [Verrucomicrobiota bacterium]